MNTNTVELGLFNTHLHKDAKRVTATTNLPQLIIEHNYPASLQWSLSLLVILAMSHFELNVDIDDDKYIEGLHEAESTNHTDSSDVIIDAGNYVS